MTTSGRPSPDLEPVTEMPSISVDDAARWRYSPRRQEELYVNRAPDIHDNPIERSEEIPTKRDSQSAPVVYIDLPETSGSIVANRQVTEDDDFEVIQSSSTRHNSKEDLDAPVLYIDLPEASGSGVARSQEHTPQEEPTFVQETIFYDPFENRRIDRAKDDSDDDSEVSRNRVRVPTPARLNTRDPSGAGPSSGPSTVISSRAYKQADLHRRPDGHPATPIPVSQFPEPPPAYTETYIRPVVSPVTPEPVVEQPRSISPKPEEVEPRDHSSISLILPLHSDRKHLTCQHCGSHVNSLVVKHNGVIAHSMGLFCLIICCYPAIGLVYCTDVLKEKRHYCTNCNKVIAFEQPLTTDKLIFVKKKERRN